MLPKPAGCQTAGYVRIDREVVKDLSFIFVLNE
jgi:hypothetical protein